MPIGRGRGRGGGLGSGGMSNIDRGGGRGGGRGGRGGGGGGGFGRFDGGGGGNFTPRKPEPASMAAILMDEKFNFWNLPANHRLVLRGYMDMKTVPMSP